MPEIILVTGASSDLGGTLIRSLLGKSPETIVLAHSFSGGKRIQVLGAEFGERVHPLTADFSDAASVTAMCDGIIGSGKLPTAIVHLPALRLQYERLIKWKTDRFRLDMAVQVESAVLIMKKFTPGMSRLPASRIVFVLSSVTRNMPPKFMSMYTVVKYAQLGLMRAAAAEYASTGLTVNAVSPSMIETQFVEEIGDVARRMSAESNPKGRNARTEDVVGTIEFLLSPAAGFITGVDMAITGGSCC